MNIDEKILHHIEKLAKLEVNNEDRELTVKKIVGVLDMLDKVADEDISALEPLYHPLEISQALRQDAAVKNIDRDALQADSPLVEKGLFLVPKVIE